MEYKIKPNTDFKTEVDKIASKFFFTAIKNIYIFLTKEGYIKKEQDLKTKVNIINNMLKDNKSVFLQKEKVRIGENMITIGNYNFVIDPDNISVPKQIEGIISWIDKKGITEQELENKKENEKKGLSFFSIINRNKKKITTDKDINNIITNIIDIILKLKIKDLVSNIKTLAKYNEIEDKKIQNIFFYDLETLGVNIVTGVFILLPINNKKNQGKISIIFLYKKDNQDIQKFNNIYNNIVLNFANKLKEKKVEIKTIFMEHNDFVKKYKIGENIVSGFNNNQFDNPILFKDFFDNQKDKAETINKRSLDLYDFLISQNDGGKLDLLAKNNLTTSKLIQSEELLSLLNPTILNDEKNYNDIYKLILYNMLDSLLILMLLEKFLLEDKHNITGITKRINKKEFLKYFVNTIRS